VLESPLLPHQSTQARQEYYESCAYLPRSLTVNCSPPAHFPQYSQVVISKKSEDSASPKSYHEIVMNAHPASHFVCLP
jgi:hypothetical protein